MEVLAAAQTPSDSNWFQGTADAVRQYCWLLQDNKNKAIEDVVILSGDHLYRMDYMQFVEQHRATNADITVGCIPCEEDRASDFGLMKINDEGAITEFCEKPKGERLKTMQVDTTILGLDKDEAQKKPYIASMGIYGEARPSRGSSFRRDPASPGGNPSGAPSEERRKKKECLPILFWRLLGRRVDWAPPNALPYPPPTVFKKKVLTQLLDKDLRDAMDFGGEVIPQAAAMGLRTQAYLFNGYW